MDEISILKLKEKMKQERIQLIDIREHYQYERGTLSGARNIPYSVLKRVPDKYLLKEDTYYMFCESGFLSKAIKDALNKKGYHIISVKEGYEDF